MQLKPTTNCVFWVKRKAQPQQQKKTFLYRRLWVVRPRISGGVGRFFWACFTQHNIDFLKKTLGFLGNHLDFGPAFGEILSKNLIRIRVSKTQI